MDKLFIKNVKKFLKTQTYHISREERDEAQSLIRQHYHQNNCISRGPCIQCGEIINYKVSSTHSSKGDRWFEEKLLKQWKKNYRIEKDGNTYKINGLVIRTVSGYLCPDCYAKLENVIIKEEKRLANQQRERIKRAQEESIALKELNSKILRGEIKSHPKKRFEAIGILVDHRYDELENYLKGYEYKDFLNTYYWDAVRQYKLYLANYKCQLCNSKGKLNVHHTTYEHHGTEHLHLEDLIVLCEECHAKFHDKVSKNE